MKRTPPAKKSKGGKESQLSYEQSLARLEEITRKLEGRGLNLEESLKIFEEGVRLCRSCLKKLEESESRIEIILQTPNGQAKTNAQGKPQTESLSSPDELLPSSSSEDENRDS